MSTRESRIDWIQLRALLRAYFQMAARGAVLFKARGKPTTLTFVVGLYFFLGAMIGLAGLMHPGVLLYSIALHTLTLFTVGMSAVIESNDVLFDQQEDEILMHRPIPPATLLAAKAGALVGFTSLLAGALNAVPTFTLLLARDARPWIPLVHVVSTALLVIFACAAVVCSYGLILRFFGREKFESLAVVAQVGMTLLFVASAQVVPQILERIGPERLDEIAHYLLFSPPAWFSAIDASLAGGEQGIATLLAAGVAVVVTIVVTWFGIGRLSAGYGHLIPVRGDVASGGGASAAPARAPIEASGKVSIPGNVPPEDVSAWRWRHPLLSRWMRDPIEWSAFRMAIAYIRRDREVKQRVYSSLAMFVVFVVLSLIDTKRHNGQFMPLMMLVMSGTIPLTVMETMRMSNHFVASEIFQAAPLETSSALFHGVRKAVIVWIQLPIAAVAMLLIVFVTKPLDMGLSLAVPVLVALPTLSLAPGIIRSYVPFSIAPRRGRQSSQNVATVLVTMAVAGGLIGVSYLAWKAGFLWILVPIEVVAVIGMHVLLLGAIRHRRLESWAEE